MPHRSAVVVLGLCAVSASALLWLSISSPPEIPESAPTRAQRAFTLHDARPSLSPSEVADLLDASDRVRSDLRAAGVVSVSDELQRRMRELTVTEDDRVAFYEANRDLFGGRSYAQSRMVIDRLIRVRAVRATLATR